MKHQEDIVPGYCWLMRVVVIAANRYCLRMLLEDDARRMLLAQCWGILLVESMWMFPRDRSGCNIAA